MPVQAKHAINTGDYVYNPGDVISDLTVEEEQRLIRLGAAVVVGDDKNNAEDSLAAALGVMTNADIAGYGKSIGLDFSSKATKADMISDILASDADVNWNSYPMKHFAKWHLLNNWMFRKTLLVKNSSTS